MFSERLNKILTLLDVTSGDFARFAGCDKSYISRMKSGARVPKNGGAGAWRIVDGICSSSAFAKNYRVFHSGRSKII